MKKADKSALERYKKRLEFARSSGGVNPYETEKEKQERIARAKKDWRFLVQYYFPHYATSDSADFQIKGAEMTAKNRTCRQFDEWGRGLAKSVWNDVIKPFGLWMRGEANYMVLVTTSKDRACELLEDLRAEFEGNPRIINDFGEQHNIGQWEKGFFITKNGFIAKGLGAGQSVRGLRVKSNRPDYISVDDLETKELTKNPKRQLELVKWIERDLIPTMDGDIRRFVYANNRFAPVMIQTLLQKRHPKWKVHRVNAYDPTTYKPTWWQKYSDTYYQEIEDDIGVLAAKAEYNNEPHIEGTIFKEEQIQWGKLPRIDHFDAICGHWDIAYAGNDTSDYNAVRLWGLKNKEFYYIDSFVKQTKMRGAVNYICEFQKIMPPSVYIHWRFEAQFWNDEVERTINEVCEEHGLIPMLTKVDTPTGNKYNRILSLQVYYQNGRIYYNEKKKSHNDTQTGLAQLYGIEPGYSTKDDAPDADQQCIEFLSTFIYQSSHGAMETAEYQRQARF